MKQHLITCIAMLGLALGLSSCVDFSQTPPPPPPPVYTPGSYEHFVATTKGYPTTMEIFRDHELLKTARSSKHKIYISLDQQRGRLYVNNRVAADWPVSTGVDGRETPTGSFRVRLKIKDHSSNRYGKIYDAEGKCVNRDADAFKDEIPEGGKFVGAGMPNWMRLTSDGVGMHTGKVRAGRRLSHGCIRTPGAMASQLYDITKIGSPVTISKGLEVVYPAHQPLAERLAANAAEKAAEEAAKAKAAAEEARKKNRS